MMVLAIGGLLASGALLGLTMICAACCLGARG